MIFEKIRERLHKEDLEFMQQSDLMECIDSVINQVEAEYNSRFEPTIDAIEFGVDGFNKQLKLEYNKGYSDAEKHYMDVIDSQHKLIDETKDNNGWIPCSERLPNEADYYLVTKEDDIAYSIDIALWDAHYHWSNNGFHKADKVIAWQPLPECYTPKGE